MVVERAGFLHARHVEPVKELRGSGWLQQAADLWSSVIGNRV
jgi:hypothetical protein